MKSKRRVLVRAAWAVAVIAVAAVVANSLSSGGRVPVTIVGARRLPDPGRVTLDIRNDAPDRVRFNNIDLWARVATNWALAGAVPLGYTNCTERAMRIDVEFPSAWPRPWKPTLVYTPAFGGAKLLRWRLRETWKPKSLDRGFRLTGWEGARHADSPEIAQ